MRLCSVHRRLAYGWPLAAQSADVLRMILGFGFRMTLAGVVIGLAGALAASRLLGSLLFQMSAINPVIFTLATVTLTAMAILASFLPARRATRIDPMKRCGLNSGYKEIASVTG